MKAAIGACALLSLLATCPAGADADIRPGAYEVTFRLELPHVESGPGETRTVCLADPESGFAVLSANNPLAHCPMRNFRREAGELMFDIVCPGGNSAKAQALFDLRADAFDGRIAMNMGGKNMTMTEVQRGRRIGDCAAEPKSKN